MVCPSRISRMWQRQSEEPQPGSSVRPDTARPVPEERGRGQILFTFCQSSNKLLTWRLSLLPCKTFPKCVTQRLGTQHLERWAEHSSTHPLNHYVDRRNIKTVEGLHLRSPAARVLSPTLRSRKCLSKPECLGRKERTGRRAAAEVWRRVTFISPAFRMVGSPSRSCYTPLKRALFASSHLPPSFFSFECFWNERVFSSKLRWEANSWTV